MSGKGKHSGKKSGKKLDSYKGIDRGIGDVTLADYANSSVQSGKCRIRKAEASLRTVCKVKQLSIQDKAWDEKLDEFEDDLGLDQEEGEDGKGVVVTKKASCRRKKTLSESMAETNKTGNTYPLDIWHLLAKYIRPEDIATFSLICRNSHSVVNSPTFWLSLYKRYYKNVPNLPSRLQPECMVRHHGLKACVIRSLFYMYPPLVARVDRASMSAPYHLKSRQCISMWQERHSYKWKLSFKLRRKDYQLDRNSGEKPNLMEILGDIFANADDGCTILQFVSSERMMLPVVMGLTVHSINMSLDMNMAHMAVQLVFGSGRICNGKLDNTGTVSVSLKSVLQVSVLEWWHPRYPHSSNTIQRSDDN
uniref:F-box domain-containing protein n=1 Tax=Graphocephala atropunctata TaxID=36148 RepID=A0A1B6KPU7_9HEMI